MTATEVTDAVHQPYDDRRMSREMPPTRREYQPHEVVSALQKAIRRSQVKEAVYWGFELWNSQYDNWAWARMHTICSEDIGPADRYLPATLAALETRSKSQKAKGKGGGMEFVHALILLASAQKSRIACYMVLEAASDHQERLEIPDEALDQHTRRGLKMGRGYEHFITEAARLVQPDTVDLTELEAEAKDHLIRQCEGEPDLPHNPWRRHANVGAEAKPALNPHTGLSGQLRSAEQLPLGNDEERR